ncbi:helix-turn-helix transcriptional regulator [Flagellimonas sp. CMM7]|uniref:helix-turn-helix domain-containing protein n=1 Tax=Flagellimonas sp. CMM7 TaxID=2654676 RepID=UPI0013D2493C|nr:helix-turn-helix transcriptional regulator [Flagellimonas sp. CMM7]UII81910.1 helix-turn-helix domain-containing protein [Flagellimonas sp. CMM7]
MVNDKIIERIQTVIDHYGLTISSFADKIGVQRSSISHLLKGRNRPSLDFVMKVVQTYPEVNLYWLLNGKGNFPNSLQNEDSPTPNPPSISIEKSNVRDNDNIKKVEASRIVVFYTDGTFESFEMKK